MNLRILLTFTFICVQLFTYTALCSDNFPCSQEGRADTNFVINSSQNGMLNKSQNDSHFVCQTFSAKQISNQRESNNHFTAHLSGEFRYSRFQALIKYIYDSSFLKINCTKLAYSTEINRRAP